MPRPDKITLADYYMGRQIEYGHELTPGMKLNSEITIMRVNELLEQLIAHDVELHLNPKTHSLLTSGWRPRGVNAATPNAAPNSKHMTCEACDIYDPDGDIDDWCMEHPARIEDIGLWMEHPSATKGWCHVQTIPPRSGKRVFYP